VSGSTPKLPTGSELVEGRLGVAPGGRRSPFVDFRGQAERIDAVDQAHRGAAGFVACDLRSVRTTTAPLQVLGNMSANNGRHGTRSTRPQVADFAALEVADHVPDDAKPLAAGLGGAGHELVDAVFAQVPLAERRQGGDLGRADRFGDGDQVDAVGGPAAGKSGAGQFAPDALQVAGESLVKVHEDRVPGGAGGVKENGRLEAGGWRNGNDTEDGRRTMGGRRRSCRARPFDLDFHFRPVVLLPFLRPPVSSLRPVVLLSREKR
jgi:hypothetical protein